MLTICEKILNFNTISHIKLENFYKKEEILMFDIETTGLSPSNSYIYIIGINYWKDGFWWIQQFFNDDGDSEGQIIQEFLQVLSNYKYLIEFNGDHFDIPFVTKRAIQLGIRSELSNLKQIQTIDLYRLIRPCKTALGLPNMKQKTIERYLGIYREDQMSGGDLIEVYHHYLRHRDEVSKKLVLLHNRDDMEGMYLISSILSIHGLTKGAFTIHSVEMKEEKSTLFIVFTLDLNSSLDQKIIHSYDCMMLSAQNKSAVVQIPVYFGALNYYYGNGKEGFSTIESYFIPSGDFNLLPVYRQKHNSKKKYVELNDDFLSNPDHLTSVVSEINRLILYANNSI